MMGFKLSTLLLIIVCIVCTYLVAWNIGWEIGSRYGWDSAILAGKVQIECKFACRKNEHRETQ